MARCDKGPDRLIEYPEVRVQLVGEDGNDFSILGRDVQDPPGASMVRSQFLGLEAPSLERGRLFRPPSRLELLSLSEAQSADMLSFPSLFE